MFLTLLLTKMLVSQWKIQKTMSSLKLEKDYFESYL